MSMMCTSFILAQEVTVCQVYYRETLSSKGLRLTLKKCLVAGLARALGLEECAAFFGHVKIKYLILKPHQQNGTE